MIPTRSQCLLLFNRFSLLSQKRIHVEEVTKLAKYLAKKIKNHPPAGGSEIKINESLLEAAGLLHDIDKNIPKFKDEQHPDTVVRVLKELGFNEVAEVVAKHSLHSILDPENAPRTWEEKLLYLADKMTKYEVIGVDHRFKLWYAEKLPPEAVKILDASYPKVKELEKEILTLAGVTLADIQKEFF